MISKKVFWLTFFALAIVFFLASTGQAQETAPKVKPPVITSSFAVDKGQYGYIWKIYIEAEDTEGAMYKIASVVDQPGAGRYSTDWIMVKPQYQHHLKGYIQWNTFSSKGPIGEFTPITLTLSIIDKAGNESNAVVFPFTFVSGVKDQYRYKLPAPFDEGNLPRLGYVQIDLFDPAIDGSRGLGFIDSGIRPDD